MKVKVGFHISHSQFGNFNTMYRQFDVQRATNMQEVLEAIENEKEKIRSEMKIEHESVTIHED